MKVDGDALHDIRQMTIIALRTLSSVKSDIQKQDPEAFEALDFSLYDILKRLTAMEEDANSQGETGTAPPDLSHECEE
jgi:hypothetical protein